MMLIFIVRMLTENSHWQEPMMRSEVLGFDTLASDEFLSLREGFSDALKYRKTTDQK